MKKLFIALMVSVSLFSSSLFAQIVTTKQSLGITEKPSVEAVLASKELEEKLTSLGIEKIIIKDRIARLTPNELQDLNDKIDELPAGGDAVVVVAAIFVLLLITDILGFTDIFSFTRPTR